jgi:hypothetical protein
VKRLARFRGLVWNGLADSNRSDGRVSVRLPRGFRIPTTLLSSLAGAAHWQTWNARHRFLGGVVAVAMDDLCPHPINGLANGRTVQTMHQRAQMVSTKRLKPVAVFGTTPTMCAFCV